MCHNACHTLWHGMAGAVTYLVCLVCIVPYHTACPYLMRKDGGTGWDRDLGQAGTPHCTPHFLFASLSSLLSVHLSAVPFLYKNISITFRIIRDPGAGLGIRLPPPKHGRIVSLPPSLLYLLSASSPPLSSATSPCLLPAYPLVNAWGREKSTWHQLLLSLLALHHICLASIVDFWEEGGGAGGRHHLIVCDGYASFRCSFPPSSLPSLHTCLLLFAGKTKQKRHQHIMKTQPDLPSPGTLHLPYTHRHWTGRRRTLLG